jgi:hypothetical protein
VFYSKKRQSNTPEFKKIPAVRNCDKSDPDFGYRTAIETIPLLENRSIVEICHNGGRKNNHDLQRCNIETLSCISSMDEIGQTENFI